MPTWLHSVHCHDIFRHRCSFKKFTNTLDNLSLTEDIDGISNDFIDKATNDFAVFCENNDIIDYIFSGKQVLALETLKCLAYIDSGQESKAVELATKQIEKGDTGQFVSANKGFFERVVIKYA